MKKLWFKRKRYGYGWYPSTWEGWFVLGIYFLLIFGTIYKTTKLGLTEAESAYMIVVVVSVLSIILVLISYLKGESPRWQWGEEKADDKDSNK